MTGTPGARTRLSPRLSRALALAWCLVTTSAAHAQVPAERELDIARSLFNTGNFSEALRRARDAMGLANFSEEQRIELHKLAALSAFNLGDKDGAERHFVQLLQLNPDYVLDPFAVPPPAIKTFEELRRKNADSLNLIRQTLTLREEQRRREAAEKERQQASAENERRRVEALSRTIELRTVEKRPWVVNVLPFGIGQFVQGRNEWGAVFAASQAVFAVVNIIAFATLSGMFKPESYTVYTAGQTDPLTITLWRVPAAFREAANVWQVVKYASGGAFYLSWALGVLDAFLHHEGSVTTTRRAKLEELEPAKPAPGAAPEAPPKPKASLQVLPVPNGAGVGLSVTF